MAKVSQIHTAVLIHQVSQACKFWIILTILIITILPLFIKALKNYIYAFWCTILQKQLSRWVENIFAWFWHISICAFNCASGLSFFYVGTLWFPVFETLLPYWRHEKQSFFRIKHFSRSILKSIARLTDIWLQRFSTVHIL